MIKGGPKIPTQEVREAGERDVRKLEKAALVAEKWHTPSEE
jgi:hypothetical protein